MGFPVTCFANMDRRGNEAEAGYTDLSEIATPGSSPAATNLRIYAKSDDNLYKKNSAGVEALIGGASARSTLGITATALGANAQVKSSVASIAKAFDVLKIVSNLTYPVRLRVYSSATFRDADATRSRFSAPNPGAQHGVILDLTLNGNTGFTWVMSPIARGETSDGTSSFYYTVDNLDLVSRDIDLTVTYLKGE